MPIAGYAEWADTYATTFGLDRDSDVRMILAWESLFESFGATVEELHAAALVLGANAPKWRADHLPGLERAIRDLRWRKSQAQAEAAEKDWAGAPCVYCRGGGWVLVPHPQHVSDGQWRPVGGSFHTATVSCSCLKGTRIYDGIIAHNEDKPKHKLQVPMRLHEYEQRFPAWQEAMRKREADRLAFWKAHNKAAALDQTYGRILSKLRRPN